jgi:hypothetical protein
MLYKYRSLRDFKFFVDIILNQRLFAAPYFDLNDPMEGHYIYDGGENSRELVSIIKGEKDQVRICSLSRTPSDHLMWAHYADGHRGVVIEVDVDKSIYDVRSVLYSGMKHVGGYQLFETAKDILSQKNEFWEYEQEERVFVINNPYIDVKIKRIILGTRINRDDEMLIERLVKKISPKTKILNSNI